MAKVIRILRPYPHSQEHLVTIDGIGGIGKSALALEVAHRYLRYYDRIPLEERFEAIIWTSAKGSMLTAEGIQPRSQALRTLDDIYTTIAVTLQREDITRARQEEQAEVVRKALTRQRTLLIVDNLETVDDEAVMSFVRELPAPTKAIVTTRHRIDVAYPVRLVGMPLQDARQLIAQECDKKAVTLNKDEVRHLYERTGGVPLAIVWSIAQMSFGYSVKAVMGRLGQPTSDIARFCFEASVECIRGKPAYRILAAFSLIATDASREALGYATDLQELDRDDGIVELEKLSLINKHNGRLGVLPLVKQYIHKELSNHQEYHSQLGKRLASYFLNELQGCANRGFGAFAELNTEVHNLSEILDWLWLHDELESYVNLTIFFEVLLWTQGYEAYWQKYVTLACKAAETIKDWASLAQLTRVKAAHSASRGSLEQTEALSKEAGHLFRRIGNEEKYGETLMALSGAYLLHGDYERAFETCQEATDVFRDHADLRHIKRSLITLADVEIRRGNVETAKKMLEEAREFLEAPETRSTYRMPELYRLLGEIGILEGKLTDAEEFLQRSLSVATGAEVQPEIAYTKMMLANLEHARGRDALAKDYLAEAYAIFERLGMSNHRKYDVPT